MSLCFILNFGLSDARVMTKLTVKTNLPYPYLIIIKLFFALRLFDSLALASSCFQCLDFPDVPCVGVISPWGRHDIPAT
jgi:hypothetical protein